MTIAYNWLCEYLPLTPDPEELSAILTAIGLEVESMEKYESVKGSLAGLVVGEVMEVTPHPNADKLRLTRVDIGEDAPLGIVCGAPNVAVGQKVVVARVGTTIYPVNGEPMTLKKAKIRGEESLGMLCAADEIGLGDDHEGILVLENGARKGMTALEYFNPFEDWIYEIGLTPNRMDAMSHLGVAKDVCAFLSNREKKPMVPVIPDVEAFRVADHQLPITVTVENTRDCPRYAGVSLTGITVGESPAWLKHKLDSIGVRPINNVVDITNLVMHECGQPLHAFDATAISGHQVIVKNLPEGTPFVTLDERERKLSAEDLMICNDTEGMCIAGVFGGRDSGVSLKTKAIFLESACFSPTAIRRTSFRHDLRTDAALRFEKGVDISGVLYALKRAATLMISLCGARVSSEITDLYPAPKEKARIRLSYDYLTRLSGKRYLPERVNGILDSLGFELLEVTADGLYVAVPYHKRDVTLPADLVEEVMRIDGYDHVLIPTHITISPALTGKPDKEAVRHLVTGYLVANGFYEIFTNSITNSRYYTDSVVGKSAVHLLNNLSADLNVLRTSLVETGLEAVAYNQNRRQEDILFFELGKTYFQQGNGFEEKERLALYLSGLKLPGHWIHNPTPVDSYFMKGHLENIFAQLGIPISFTAENHPPERLSEKQSQSVMAAEKKIGTFGLITPETLQSFDIRQPVWFADLDWEMMVRLSAKNKISFHEIPRYPAVRRDLALILDRKTQFAEVEDAARSLKNDILQQIQLFDVFESDKLGPDKKSYAISFIFRHREKTLTDQEIEAVMQKLISVFEKRLQAEIRK